jgi:hypothetical protein
MLEPQAQKQTTHRAAYRKRVTDPPIGRPSGNLWRDASWLRENGFTVTPPMPLYRDKLTEEEQTNLIAFLSSLRGPAVREELH